MYGAPIWCLPPSTSSHQMELLRSFERNCLRSTANIQRPIGCYKHVKIKQIYEKSSCIRIDRFAAQRHISFYNKCKHATNSKFKFENKNQNRVNLPYKHISHIFNLHENGQLLTNDDLLIFHTRYNNHGLVYCTDQ